METDGPPVESQAVAVRTTSAAPASRAAVRRVRRVVADMAVSYVFYVFWSSVRCRPDVLSTGEITPQAVNRVNRHLRNLSVHV
ncbi:hypothetical protein GCM10009639_65430 [Kitasatospora putterlickiae]|uniref:Uncharacterized protein n=1 Tax=Kitasatospora putterlickiae TaxID=221725 RepID=A0ABN1YGQ9_9ACTN